MKITKISKLGLAIVFISAGLAACDSEYETNANKSLNNDRLDKETNQISIHPEANRNDENASEINSDGTRNPAYNGTNPNYSDSTQVQDRADSETSANQFADENILPIDEQVVYFEAERSSLSEEAEERLDEMVDKVEESNLTAMSITISAITESNSKNPESYNKVLTERRAETVKEYLMDQGVNADNWDLKTVEDDSQLLSDNNASDEKSEKARVIVSIISPKVKQAES